MTIDDLIDAWRANNTINLELLNVCSDEDLELKPGKGKTIRSNYVHIISVRRMWCEEKIKGEAERIPKLDWKTATRQEIEQGLAISGEIMEALFRKREEKPGKHSVLLYFAYYIAHEANHRSQIEIALRINDREPDDKLLYALWDWTQKGE